MNAVVYGHWSVPLSDQADMPYKLIWEVAVESARSEDVEILPGPPRLIDTGVFQILQFSACR
jgi:hypothetical protein